MESGEHPSDRHRLRPLLVIGTRPEAIKMAPIVLECQARPGEVEPLVCLTGQHREMVRSILAYFRLDPRVDLGLMREGQTLTELTARALTSLGDVIVRERPHCVVAQGDTTSVLAASMASFYAGVPFVHVEAGLRTRNLMAPWPEEFNRRVSGLVASLHCAPTPEAAANLLAEGTAADAVHVTGNPVIDALLMAQDRERGRDAFWRARYAQFGDRRLVLITGHRRENLDGGIANVCRAIADAAQEWPDVAFAYAVHLNPAVQEPVRRLLGGLSNVHLLPPVDYPEFVWLMSRSALIVSDSGGVQEEAPSLGKPVLVTRDTTERPEAVRAGAVELVGCDPYVIVERVRRLLSDPAEYRRRQVARNPYGDGHAAVRIVDLMLSRGWQLRRAGDRSPTSPGTR